MSNLAWALISSRATKRDLTSFKCQRCVLCVIKKQILRCSELQRVLDPFVHQIGLLLESSVNTTRRDWAGEDIVQVILDPSILLSWCEVKDESALDKLFSNSRSLYYAMHSTRSALLDSYK